MSGKGGKVNWRLYQGSKARFCPPATWRTGAYWFDGKERQLRQQHVLLRDTPETGWAGLQTRPRSRTNMRTKKWFGAQNYQGSERKLYSALEAAPGGNELIQKFALRRPGRGKKVWESTEKIDVPRRSAIRRTTTWVIATDPIHPRLATMAIRADKLIGELIRAAEAQAGAGSVIVVLTADHGVLAGFRR